jgi:hypothetical protein
VDDTYFQDGHCPPEALSRPRLQGIAVENETLYEFIAFAHGLRRHTLDMRAIVDIQEVWLEPKPDLPFIYRVSIYYTFPAVTTLLALTGETQDLAQDFVARLKYLRGW